MKISRLYVIIGITAIFAFNCIADPQHSNPNDPESAYFNDNENPGNLCGNGVTDAGEACDDGNAFVEKCTYGNTTAILTCGSNCQYVPCEITYCGDNETDSGNGEECDDGNAVTETCLYGETSCVVCNSSCISVAGVASYCGDGYTDASNGETCDGDGTGSGGETVDCDADCSAQICGDGTVNSSAGEECDSSGTDSVDCNGLTCKLSACGDGYSNEAAGETCDDGNLDDNDGCSSVCQTEYCGDNIAQTGEICDDGNESNNDACLNSCIEGSCGDGFIYDGVETCDDNNSVTEKCTYGSTGCTVCDASCQSIAGATSYCGDTVIDTVNGEKCDDGNAVSGDGCSDNCLIEGICGNGMVEAYEDCDTEGIQTEFCEIDCKAPVCGDTFFNALAGEECDNGVLNSDTLPNSCRTNCRLPYCGDSVADTGEECDGGGIDTNSCDYNCTFAVCGDFHLNLAAGEDCDTGGADSYLCDAALCLAPACGDGTLSILSGEQCDDGNLTSGDGCSDACLNEAVFVKVYAGTSHTLAMKSDGSLWGWGYNVYGQLGDGTNIKKHMSVQISADTDWASVSGSWHHVMAIKTNGTLWAWGYNVFGQLGDGTEAGKNTPVQIGSDTDWAFVSAGNNHTVALKTNGTLWAWGWNSDGQLGDNSTTQKKSPVQIGSDTDWAFVSAGFMHTLAVKTDGTLWAWGRNGNGQLGLGDSTTRKTPQLVGACSIAGFYTQTDCETNSGIWNYDTDWSIALAGNNLSAALKTGGSLYRWGYDPIFIDSGFTSIFSVSGNIAAVKADGTLWTMTAGSAPSQKTTDADWIDVSAGYAHTAAVKTDGTLWAWGENDDGQLGDGTTVDSSLPILVTPNMNLDAIMLQTGAQFNWAMVSAGSSYTMAIKAGGTLWGWGTNGNYKLGDGSITTRYAPVQIGIDTNWLSVSAGNGSHTMGIKTDGSLWGWGYNLYGQLGDGASSMRYVPKNIGTDINWRMVSAGNSHTAAVKTDGTLYTWGFNNVGQLGLGDTTTRKTPQLLGLCTIEGFYTQADCETNFGVWNYDTDWAVVSAGFTHTVAVKTDGTLWAWGKNDNGQLGDGTTTNSLVPKFIGDGYSKVSTFDRFTAAVKTDGTLWAWGRTTGSYAPLKIGTDTNWAFVSAGNEHTLAMKTDGSLWAWGGNKDGQLCDGSYENRSLPHLVGLNYDWSQVSAGWDHSVAIKTNAGLYACGNNAFGQLGR
ncbi:MAG: DUF4215 domain-containing protein [Spirochaetia bacterium]|nr:DUF4215 domain-containing protein [Spirochaetia bacterium]